MSWGSRGRRFKSGRPDRRSEAVSHLGAASPISLDVRFWEQVTGIVPAEELVAGHAQLRTRHLVEELAPLFLGELDHSARAAVRCGAGHDVASSTAGLLASSSRICLSCRARWSLRPAVIGFCAGLIPLRRPYRAPWWCRPVGVAPDRPV